MSSKPLPEALPAPIFVISGGIGAGKTTISERLMERFSRGIHIAVDDLRGFVVSGYANPAESWTDETDLQFRLARATAASMAARYAKEGFAVAIDDIITPDEVDELFLPVLQGHQVHRILLRPSLQATLQRNATRTNKSFDTSVLVETLHLVYGRLEGISFVDRGWHVIDTGSLSVEETVDLILQHYSRHGRATR